MDHVSDTFAYGSSIRVGSDNWESYIPTTFSSLFLQPVAVGYELFKGRPRLAAWRERVEAFLGAELCQEAHSLILSILEQAAKKTLPTPPPEVYPTMLLRIARIP